MFYSRATVDLGTICMCQTADHRVGVATVGWAALSWTAPRYVVGAERTFSVVETDEVKGDQATSYPNNKP